MTKQAKTTTAVLGVPALFAISAALMPPDVYNRWFVAFGVWTLGVGLGTLIVMLSRYLEDGRPL